MKTTRILIMASVAVLTLANSCKKSDPDEYIDVAKYTIYVVGEYNNSVNCYWINSERTIIADESRYYSMYGSYVSNGDVYTCGTAHTTGYGKPVYFKNKTIVELEADEHSNCRVNYIHVSNGVVFTAGSHSSWNVYSKCYWTNTARTDFSDVPVGTKEFEITGLFACDGDVYISGHYTDRDNVTYACYWKNGVRTDMPESPSWGNSIFVDNGKVYLAGSYDRNTLTGTVSEAGYWEDGKFVLVERNLFAKITDIFVEKGTVYTCSGMIPGFSCYWTGNTKTSFAEGEKINSIFVKDGIVFTAGYHVDHKSQNSFYNPCYWIKKKRVDLSITELRNNQVNELIGIFVE